jgi:hypothetical protein
MASAGEHRRGHPSTDRPWQLRGIAAEKQVLRRICGNVAEIQRAVRHGAPKIQDELTGVRCTRRFRAGSGAAVSSYSNPESHFWNWSKCRLRRSGDGRRHRQEKTAPAAGLSKIRLCVLVRRLRQQCELSSSSARSMHQRRRSQSRKGERLREVA